MHLTTAVLFGFHRRLQISTPSEDEPDSLLSPSPAIPRTANASSALLSSVLSSSPSEEDDDGVRAELVRVRATQQEFEEKLRSQLRGDTVYASLEERRLVLEHSLIVLEARRKRQLATLARRRGHSSRRARFVAFMSGLWLTGAVISLPYGTGVAVSFGCLFLGGFAAFIWRKVKTR